MPKIEETEFEVPEEFHEADKLSQAVLNDWGAGVKAVGHSGLSDAFKALCETTFTYRTARQHADNRRQFNALSEAEAAEEKTAHEVFVKACNAFKEKHKQATS